MTELTLTFTREKDTKNTVRYREVVPDGDPGVVGSIYVQKFALKELGQPEQLTVVIRAGSGEHHG